MSDTRAERQLLAQIASHASWANTPDRNARTAPARRAFDAKFLAEAEGDPVKAEHLRKAHYARLALLSAKSRRKAREALNDAEAAEAELAQAGGGVA